MDRRVVLRAAARGSRGPFTLQQRHEEEFPEVRLLPEADVSFFCLLLSFMLLVCVCFF